jgi:hypothetical protein
MANRTNIRVLVACEYSGTVREAFRRQGFDAWSCDILPTEMPGQHFQMDVRHVLDQQWDLMIAHPPCTYLSRAGARWKSPERTLLAEDAMQFFMELWNAPIPRIAIENPVGSTWRWRTPDQIIQPWHFEHAATNATCLWLKAVPPLMYTIIHPDPMINWTEFGHRTAKARSRTFQGIADAMAHQWGAVL